MRFFDRRWWVFHHSGALRIALVYIVAGLLWITFSDELVARFIQDRALANWLSIGKGYAYVLVTGVLLYAAIRRLNTRYRLAQMRVVRSERAYRAMFDDNPNPMFVYDPSTLCFLDVNSAAVDKYGYTRAEFLQMTLRNISPSEEHIQRLYEIDTKAGTGNFVQISPVTHQTKQRHMLEIEITISALRMPERNVRLMLVQDISLRVRVERELLESRNQLSDLQRIAGIGSWSADHDSGVVTLSEQMVRLLGGGAGGQAWTIQALFERVHPEDRAALQTGFNDAWRGLPLRLELRLLRSGGEILYVLLGAERIARDEGGSQLIGTILDIDERRRSEKKLQDSERQYRQSIDDLPEAVLIYREGKLIFANPAAATLFGATRAEALLGTDVDAFIAAPSKDAARSRLEWLQAGVDRIDNRFQERLLRKLSGEVFAAEVAARSTMINGEHCIQAVVRDISEQKKNQEDLHRANERLLHLSTHMIEAAESERLHLSRELHDDLGQSLTFVKMTVGWLRKRLQHDEMSERIEQLYRAASEALGKVRDLSQALRPAQLDTLGLKSAMEEHLHKYCDGGAIQYAVSVEDLQPRPDPDIETALFRIFQEALTNIFRHSGANFIEVELARRNRAIELRVVDDGCGFDVAEALARGTNLGLHTMSERARQLHGDVKWLSLMGAGTEMIATIPEHAL